MSSIKHSLHLSVRICAIALLLAHPSPDLFAADRTLQVGKHRLHVEIAENEFTRRIGLMGRERLANDAGMLFVLDSPSRVGMWMRNTKIDLDAAFVTPCGIISNIETMKRGTDDIHYAAVPSLYVIETNSGWFSQRKIGQGFLIPALISKKHCPGSKVP